MKVLIQKWQTVLGTVYSISDTKEHYDEAVASLAATNDGIPLFPEPRKGTIPSKSDIAIFVKVGTLFLDEDELIYVTFT